MHAARAAAGFLFFILIRQAWGAAGKPGGDGHHALVPIPAAARAGTCEPTAAVPGSRGELHHGLDAGTGQLSLIASPLPVQGVQVGSPVHLLSQAPPPAARGTLCQPTLFLPLILSLKQLHY